MLFEHAATNKMEVIVACRTGGAVADADGEGVNCSRVRTVALGYLLSVFLKIQRMEVSLRHMRCVPLPESIFVLRGDNVGNDARWFG